MYEYAMANFFETTSGIVARIRTVQNMVATATTPARRNAAEIELRKLKSLLALRLSKGQ